jgi:crotonobetainyl-CoA:carnitine CoA-transferase CaiB-like acyl-CoA transferase
MARGASTLTGGFVCYHVYQTRDGRYMTLAALEPPFWAQFCRTVARPDLLGQQFAPAVCGEPAYDELCALFRSRTRDEWIRAFAGADGCCEPVYTLEEALSAAPVRALRMLADSGILPPVRLSAAFEIGQDPAPALGQHTAELLAELGYDEQAVAELKRRGVV